MCRYVESLDSGLNCRRCLTPLSCYVVNPYPHERIADDVEWPSVRPSEGCSVHLVLRGIGPGKL
ncbi:MAG: hypothetical protein K0R79_2029 [Stenotrophomonas indicatrix]|nr:hypothetical protein [Stenotrophomonas indicatrix]